MPGGPTSLIPASRRIAEMSHNDSARPAQAACKTTFKQVADIDFAAINQAAIRSARSLLPELIPGGKFRSLEYIARNPRRDDQRPGSFSINYKTGVWKDFASEDGGGDLISLVAYLRGISQGDAARELAAKLSISTTPKSNGAAASAPSTNSGSASGVRPWSNDGPPPQQGEVRRHSFKNADGDAVRIKIKFDNGKYANWYRVLDEGHPAGWQAKKPDDFRPVPYITAALNPFDPELKNDEILWPEGEKDVDTLSRVHLPAFTFGGVGDGLPDGIGPYLADRHVVVLADNDDPGRQHAEKKAAVAHAASAASIRIVQFPELPPKGDISDFFASGGIPEELFRRMDAAPIWSRPQDESASPAETVRQDWRARIVTAKQLQGMSFPPAPDETTIQSRSEK
jgi:putative DNA primase/helicase